MAFVQPARQRFRVIDDADSYRLIIPAYRSIFVILFLLFWLGGWCTAEVAVISNLINGTGKSGDGPLFMIFWLGGWTLGGCAAFSILLWMIGGKDVIEIEHGMPQHLARRMQLFGLALRSQEFAIDTIRNLRTSRNYGRRGSVMGNCIAFDYGAKTYRFGWGMEEAEAELALKALLQQLPPIVAAAQ